MKIFDILLWMVFMMVSFYVALDQFDLGHVLMGRAWLILALYCLLQMIASAFMPARFSAGVGRIRRYVSRRRR